MGVVLFEEVWGILNQACYGNNDDDADRALPNRCSRLATDDCAALDPPNR
jgi:hypothetical protein